MLDGQHTYAHPTCATQVSTPCEELSNRFNIHLYLSSISLTRRTQIDWFTSPRDLTFVGIRHYVCVHRDAYIAGLSTGGHIRGHKSFTYRTPSGVNDIWSEKQNTCARTNPGTRTLRQCVLTISSNSCIRLHTHLLRSCNRPTIYSLQGQDLRLGDIWSYASSVHFIYVFNYSIVFYLTKSVNRASTSG